MKPILFSTEMVHAILDGRKTQTRRLGGLDDLNKSIFSDFEEIIDRGVFKIRLKPQVKGHCILTPKFQKDDILWVRETWKFSPEQCVWQKYSYKADYPNVLSELGKWKSSIHMPKEAARIFLKITNVRCERLHDISEDDAIAEGCSLYGPFGEYKGSIHPNGGGMRYRAYSTAKRAFQCIWESINGDQSWKENPFVWVYEFEIIEKPEDFLL